MDYGNYGIFLIMGNAGFISATILVIPYRPLYSSVFHYKGASARRTQRPGAPSVTCLADVRSGFFSPATDAWCLAQAAAWIWQGWEPWNPAQLATCRCNVGTLIIRVGFGGVYDSITYPKNPILVIGSGSEMYTLR